MTTVYANIKLGPDEERELRQIAKDARTTVDKLVSGIVGLYLRGQLARPKNMTEAEKEEARDLTRRGYSHRQVAKLMNRTPSAVMRALKID